MMSDEKRECEEEEREEEVEKKVVRKEGRKRRQEVKLLLPKKWFPHDITMANRGRQ